MIRRIAGTIIHTELTAVVVDVAGVGYLVRTSVAGTSYKLDTPATFWTYHAIRETALDLYGFETRDELEMFELLLGLPKIGPKSAAQILSQADLTLLKQAVTQEDPTYLSKMSGIGKKTAEKIVVGLKDKFESMGITADQSTSQLQEPTNWQRETIDALITLGYPQKDAREAVLALPPEYTSTNEALPVALRTLSE